MRGQKTPKPAAAPAEPARPEQFDALPKRFRDYIGKLESEIAALRRSLPALEPTRIKVVNRLRRDGEYYLPEGTAIAFRFGKSDHDEVEVQLKPSRRGDDEMTLEVSANAGGLAIWPEVSNVIAITRHRHGA